MTDLESLVRATLTDEAQHAPPGHDLVARVDERVRADRPAARAAWLAAAACLALATVVGGATVLVGRQPTALRPGGSATSPAGTDAGDGAGATAAVPDLPLVTDGLCAGLRVRLALPGPNPGQVGTVRPLVPGTGNRWSLDGMTLLYLQATGPCVDRLTYDITHDDRVHRFQGSDGDVGQRFSGGLGPLVPDVQQPGTARVDVVLGCPPGAYCADARTVLATLTVSVTKAGPQTTRQPTSGPDVRSTVTYTQNGTVTSSVTSPPPGGGAETVTETVSP
ncbi:hypothetical protein [Terrabacter sp. 2RAF25]|uniref:hypothetical protein n=1 Tax=Terrabacter sp. 2RAF25 TaxID=3232998 RepID=UPI003F9C0CF2